MVKPERRRPAVTQGGGRRCVFLTSRGARWVLGGGFVETVFFFGESRLHPSAGKFDQAFPNIPICGRSSSGSHGLDCARSAELVESVLNCASSVCLGTGTRRRPTQSTWRRHT